MNFFKNIILCLLFVCQYFFPCVIAEQIEVPGQKNWVNEFSTWFFEQSRTGAGYQCIYDFNETDKTFCTYGKISKEGNTTLGLPKIHVLLLDSVFNSKLSDDSTSALSGTFPSDSIQTLLDPYSPKISFIPGSPVFIPREIQNYSRERLYSHGSYKDYVQSAGPILIKGEVLGEKKKIFDTSLCNFFQYEDHGKNRILLVSSLELQSARQFVTTHRLEDEIKKGIFIKFEPYKYKAILQKSPPPKSKNVLGVSTFFFVSDSKLDSLLTESSQPISSLRKAENAIIELDSFTVSNLPIICIDIDHHYRRNDKNDWNLETYVNNFSGDFFQYIMFSKSVDYKFPFNIRDLALDYCAGVNDCRKSTVAVFLNTKNKIVTQNSNKQFDTTQIIMALVKNKQWRPQEVPEDKNTIPKNRLMLMNEPGKFFGSWCPIWELDIWQRLGIQLKRNPEAEVYLCGYGTLLQAAETKTVEEEHALIKKCGVLITPTMYQIFDRMRPRTGD